MGDAEAILSEVGIRVKVVRKWTWAQERFGFTAVNRVLCEAYSTYQGTVRRLQSNQEMICDVH